MALPSFPRRGSVYYVRFDPAEGAEIRKTRPAVVVSNDVANRYSPIVIVVPLTSRNQAHYDEVLIVPPEGGLKNPSVIVPNQITAADKRRLGKRLGRLAPHTIEKLNWALKATLDLLD